MDGNVIQVIFGEGRGKTAAALGKCIQAVSLGRKVVFISFLKGRNLEEFSCTARLEPDMKVFCFEKEEECYDMLPDDRKEEEKYNLMNAFHFANKVVETGECDLLVLDEVLGMLDLGMISVQDIYRLIEHCDDRIDLIMTGKYMPKELVQHTDIVSEIQLVKDSLDSAGSAEIPGTVETVIRAGAAGPADVSGTDTPSDTEKADEEIEA